MNILLSVTNKKLTISSQNTFVHKSLLHKTKPQRWSFICIVPSSFIQWIKSLFSHAKGHLYIFNICTITLSYNIHQASLTMNTYRIYKQGYCIACQNVGIASTDDTAKPHTPKSQTTKMILLRLLPNGIIWHTTASVLIYHITGCNICKHSSLSNHTSENIK